MTHMTKIRPDRRNSRPLKLAAGVSLALAIAAVTPAHAVEEQVGTAAAVNPSSTARGLLGTTRTIVLGQSIAHKERIQTTGGGSVQLLFLDKTSMTIGPNSDVSIDEYVYDPKTNTGKLAASLAKGVMRFVGGQISHAGEAEIKTASAVVGIRGGVAVFSGPSVYAGYGQIFVSSNGQTVTLGAGDFTTTSFNNPPTPPGPPPEGFVGQIVGLFQSLASQTGGTTAGHASQKNVTNAENRATGGNGTVSGTPPTNNVTPPPTTTNNNITQTIQGTIPQTTTPPPSQQPTQPQQPAYRPATTLTGFVGGLMTSFLNSSSSTTGFTGSNLGDAEITLDPVTNSVQVTLKGNNTPRIGSAPESPNNGLFRFGSANGSNGVYVDYNNFAATGATDANGNPTSLIDAQPITNQTSTVTTLTRSQTQQLASAAGVQNLTVCECEYTRWGIWASQSQQNVGGRNYTDLVAGTWVVGKPAQASDMPLTGSATYVGHVMANISDNGTQKFAFGNWTSTVDFGQRSLATNVTNLDNTNYSGGLTFAGNTPAFGGTLQGDVGYRAMSVNGTLMQGKTSPVGEMGGSVAITGTNYLGSGIFAAARR